MFDNILKIKDDIQRQDAKKMAKQCNEIKKIMGIEAPCSSVMFKRSSDGAPEIVLSDEFLDEDYDKV
jgi:hypothetical protein